MNSDIDALAAYFEAWREGWPVPACLPVVDIGIIKGDGDLSSFMDKDIAEFAEALTGVLVVELARRNLCNEEALYRAVEAGLSEIVHLWMLVNHD